jgi:catechol 2,3-dioxygenase-like lactoylglutathione lyase family enzyme
MIPNLPTPMLGEITAITIATPDLEKSLHYYEQLGFKELMRDTFPFPWIQITDEALLIMLRKDKDPYIALTYYSKDGKKVADKLEADGISFTSKPKATDMLHRYLMQSPDGLNISIITIPDGFRRPSGTTMLTMNPSDYSNPEAYTNNLAGMFGELAQPVKNLEDSISFWQKLGFIVLSAFESPYPWAILSDGLSVVGLHQSTHFDHPAITYFASDMKDKIEALKKQGLENFTEKNPGNIVLNTPEGQHVFLFSMG